MTNARTVSCALLLGCAASTIACLPEETVQPGGTGGTVTGTGGTGPASTGGAATGGRISGSGGIPATGGSKAATGGTGTGGKAASSGGTSGSGSCQKGQTKGSEVVIMGESFYAMSPQYIQQRIQSNARAAGSLGASDSYRNVAVSGQPMSYIASTEWNSVKGSTVSTSSWMAAASIVCRQRVTRVRARSRPCSARWLPPECWTSSTRATRNRETRPAQTPH